MTRPTFYIVRLFIVKYLRLFNHAFNLSTKRSIVRVDASDAADVGIAETIILMLIRIPEAASLEARTEVVISRDNSLITRQEVNTRRDSPIVTIELIHIRTFMDRLTKLKKPLSLGRFSQGY